jgi:NTP pyrophosphatase (non-canonical NTP hydrolase)
MINNIDLNKYKDFVEAITSRPSNYLTDFINRLDQLSDNHDDSIEEYGPKINISLLITGALGLSSECGEFNEIVKKMLFQGKPLTKENLFHMERELGDIMWYWINTCRALGLDPNKVIEGNVDKLMSRYPGGAFDVTNSENRKENDL